MRTVRNTILVVAALGAAALPTQAVAAAGHSFAGSCEVLGETAISSEGLFAQHETYSATGTCTGLLDGASRRIYRVRVTTSVNLEMFQMPTVKGRGTIRFARTRRPMSWRFSRSLDSVIDIRGTEGTSAVGLMTEEAGHVDALRIQAPIALRG